MIVGERVARYSVAGDDYGEPTTLYAGLIPPDWATEKNILVLAEKGKHYDQGGNLYWYPFAKPTLGGGGYCGDRASDRTVDYYLKSLTFKIVFQYRPLEVFGLIWLTLIWLVRRNRARHD